ncbi:MAG: hypothetical protein PHO90_00085 [Candidatus Pacebacteria bacterium]|nr:hypothetical protein [Candidatus Paceibacterota bacterium]
MKQILNLLFPKTCLVCKRKGSHLCEDCFSLIEINPFQRCICGKSKGVFKCPECPPSLLDGLFVSADLNQSVLKKTISSYSSIKELSMPLVLIILTHFFLLGKDRFPDFVVFPCPIGRKEEKRTGFSETREIAKILSEKLKMPLMENPDQVKDKNVLVLDIVYDASRMEKLAEKLKQNQARQVFGLVVAKH